MALKYSRQREVIKNCLTNREDHPTADMVYMDVRETFPNISLGTVYRNLQLLTDLGEIQKLNVGDGVDHFDAKTFPRDIPDRIDIVHLQIDTIRDIAGVNFDGQIAGHITYFYGICGNCCKKGK